MNETTQIADATLSKVPPPVDVASVATERADFRLIAGLVAPNAKVIDIGCGDGTLLQLLASVSHAKGCGIELSQEGVSECVSKGLSVVQGDADLVLQEYPDDVFDYAILSHTLQATRNPQIVLSELLRIAKKAIVSFHNFGYWRIRGQLLWRGRMPIYRGLPYQWYETPNIHFCTIRDFRELCAAMKIKVISASVIDSKGEPVRFMQNILGEQALFLISR